MKKNEKKPTGHSFSGNYTDDKLSNVPELHVGKLSEGDLLKLVQELNIHKIELELQNEELQAAKEKAEDLAELYTDLFSEIYNHSPAGYYRLNLEGEICELNLNGASILGYDRADLIDKPFKQFVAPDSKNLFEDLLSRASESGTKQSCELMLDTYKGKPAYIRMEALVSGDPRKFLVNAFDITEQKHVEYALRDSEERYRTLIEKTPTGIAIYQAGKFVYLNPAAISTIGATRAEDLLGKPVLSIVHPESKAQIISRMEMVMKGFPVEPMEEKLIRLDGTTIIGEVIAIPVNFNGIPSGQVIFTDITDRKEAESKLKKSEALNRNLILHIPLSIFLKNKKSEYISANESYARNLGINPEEIAGKDDFDFHPKELAEQYRLDDQEVMSSGLFGNFEEKYILDGEPRWAHTIKVPYKDETGGIAGVLGIFEDITDRRNLEIKIKASETHLEELNATKDKFFSIIAHDLKNPFNTIIGFSQILKDQLLEHDYSNLEKFVSIIHSSAVHTGELLENLLNWASSQQGKIPFVPERINFLEIMNSKEQLLLSEAEKKNIRITRNIPVDIMVRADVNMLSTCLRNLVSNAIKFTPRNGTIIISANVQNNEFHLSVMDNGIGMTKEETEKLFRIETGFTKPGTEKEKGTGLGLILCKEFVEKHGGKISVSSEPGKGSNFTMTIPVHDQDN